jgi:hypothetical protein
MSPKDIDALAVALNYLQTGRTEQARETLEDLHRRVLDEALRKPRPSRALAQ